MEGKGGVKLGFSQIKFGAFSKKMPQNRLKLGHFCSKIEKNS
jgi:hypothetical protein